MIIDLTHTITSDMAVFPGSPAPSLTSNATLSRTGHRETQINITSHTGTHMDAPYHLLREGVSLDKVPVAQFCGRAVVLDVSSLPDGRTITAADLEQHRELLQCSDFILLYTGWEKKWGTEDYFHDGYAVPDESAARFLVSCGLKGIGTDAISVDTLAHEVDHSLPIHKIFLGDSLVILENLCLKKLVGRSDIMLFALPMKFENADGAPIRAVAEIRSFSEKESEEV